MKERIERTSWLLFNDFAISPVSAIEAVHFNPTWKACHLVMSRQPLILSDAVNPVLQEARDDCSGYCRRHIAAVHLLQSSDH